MPDAIPALRVLAVVPVYNHAPTLRAVVQGLLALDLPVLVVDDGSTDDPLSRVRDLPCACLRFEVNRGKGVALRAGAEAALAEGYAAVLTLDADGQHFPEDAPGLLQAAGAQWPAIVLGCRDMASPNVPASSRFGRAFSNFWVRLECGRTLGDTQSGYRLYPAGLLAGMLCRSRRYAFEVEILVRAAWAGVPILDHPVRVTYAPGAERVSHFLAFRDNLRFTCLHVFLLLRSLGPRPSLDGSSLVQRGRDALRHPVRFLKSLAGEHGSPLELAAATGMGVFIGSLPIIPFGIVTILYVNRRLNLNRLAGVGASNLCVAPFVPFLCVQAGHFLRFGRFWTDFSRQTLLSELHLRVWEWLLGALVLGPLLGLAVGALTYQLVKRLRRA